MAKFYAIKELSTGQYLVVDGPGKVDMDNPVLSDKPITYFYPEVTRKRLVTINDYLKNTDGNKFVLVELTEKVVEDDHD